MASICRIVSATGPHCTAPEVRLQALPPHHNHCTSLCIEISKQVIARKKVPKLLLRPGADGVYAQGQSGVGCLQALTQMLSILVAFARSACAIQGAAGVSAVSR